MNTINIDIDGVLRYFLKSAHITLREFYPNKTPETINDTREWGMETHYPLIPKKELFNFLFDIKAKEVFLDNAEPFPGAKAFLNKLRKNGFVVVLNTHQNAKTLRYTVQWLQKHKLRYDYLVSSVGQDKHVVPGILIDDKFDNCNPETDLLFTRSSNKNALYLGTRVNNYKEIFEYLDKQ